MSDSHDSRRKSFRFVLDILAFETDRVKIELSVQICSCDNVLQLRHIVSFKGNKACAWIRKTTLIDTCLSQHMCWLIAKSLCWALPNNSCAHLILLILHHLVLLVLVRNHASLFSTSLTTWSKGCWRAANCCHHGCGTARGKLRARLSRRKYSTTPRSITHHSGRRGTLFWRRRRGDYLRLVVRVVIILGWMIGGMGAHANRSSLAVVCPRRISRISSTSACWQLLMTREMIGTCCPKMLLSLLHHGKIASKGRNRSSIGLGLWRI